MTAEEYQTGQVLLIDKPLKWTSFQVVNKLRWAIRRKFSIKKIKVGHAGTLDPLATGLLIVCTGKFTKRINEYQGMCKEYSGSFTIGATTPSYDRETEINTIFSIAHITEKLIRDTTSKFLGQIKQKPPLFSAVKKDGKRLYELARKGETTEIPTRLVHVYEFDITQINFFDTTSIQVDFRIKCGKGTYIRSLAYDFGKALNSGAYLSQLRRTKIGDFDVVNAKNIDSFIENLEKS